MTNNLTAWSSWKVPSFQELLSYRHLAHTRECENLAGDPYARFRELSLLPLPMVPVLGDFISYYKKALYGLLTIFYCLFFLWFLN